MNPEELEESTDKEMQSVGMTCLMWVGLSVAFLVLCACMYVKSKINP